MEEREMLINLKERLKNEPVWERIQQISVVDEGKWIFLEGTLIIFDRYGWRTFEIPVQ